MTTESFTGELCTTITPFTEAEFRKWFTHMQHLAFNNNVNKGWHDAAEVKVSSIEGKMSKLFLIMGEASEVGEALRDGNPPSKKIPAFTSEAEELADIVIRSMDYAQREGIDLAAAIMAKHTYNTTRRHRHGGKLI